MKSNFFTTDLINTIIFLNFNKFTFINSDTLQQTACNIMQSLKAI